MEEQLVGERGVDGLAAIAGAITEALTSRDRDDTAGGRCSNLVRQLGFDGFSYLLVRPGTVGTELLRHWSTAGPRWNLQYRKHAFQLVDPRVKLTWGRTAPLPWRLGNTGIDPRSRAFEAAATVNGVGGGVAISMQLSHGERAIAAWDWQPTQSGDSRQVAVRKDLAAIALLACFLQDELARNCLPRDACAKTSSLTVRERECLTLASRGMTSSDMAAKVGIAERTVNFHMGNLARKLGALNRGEAIARGVALNLVRRET